MIIVRIVGGLASQLHKYAIGRALALRLDTDLKLDLEWFNNRPPSDTPWPYQLGKFSLVADIATAREIRRVRGSCFWNHWCGYINRKFGAFLWKSREIDISKVIPEQWGEIQDNVYLYGEVGGDALFRPIRHSLLEEFKLRAPLSEQARLYAQEIRAEAYPVSIHVRRGDFIANPAAAQFHALTGLDYFQQAVHFVLRTHANAKFFVFSDDHLWVNSNLMPILPASSVTVSSLANEEDFVLMSQCHGNIICNSGFGWMAAWLNNCSDRIVISPTRWLHNDTLNAYAMRAMHQPDWVYM